MGVELLHERGDVASTAAMIAPPGRGRRSRSRRPTGPEARPGTVAQCNDNSAWSWEKKVSEQRREEALQRVVSLCAHDDEVIRRAVASLWDEAFETGRLGALDELQDRFCVCMK
jgi:hypothetical protein